MDTLTIPNPPTDSAAPPIPVKVVFLNGPPGAGKDTAGGALEDFFPNSVVMKMARRLKESVHADYGCPELPHDFFEGSKELPNEVFFGATPRQAYIDKSEKRTKPFLGKDFFGRIFVRDMAAEYGDGADLVFITDSGFADECAPVLRAIGGPQNALLVRIEATGRGKSFANDSRSYLTLPDVKTLTLDNNGNQADFEDAAIDAVWQWLGYGARPTAVEPAEPIEPVLTAWQRVKARLFKAVEIVAMPIPWVPPLGSVYAR